MSDLDNATQRTTIKLAATVGEHIYIEADGTLPSANGRALGVVHTAGKSGDHVAVAGIVPVTAGAAVAVGAALKVTAAGKVITHTSGTERVAHALEAATKDGDLIRCLLIAN